MQKILFVTSKSLGGSGKYISTLAAALRERGHHCELIYYPMGVVQDGEIEAAFSAVHHFKARPGFSPIGVAANVARVREVLMNNHFDWVHTHTSLGGLFGKVGATLARSGARVGATIHAYGADEFTPVPQKWVYWVIERFLDLLTDAYVSPSQYMVDYGRRIHVIGSNKATVIHNSLPLQPPSADVAKLRLSKRAALGLADDQMVFLFCGRLEQQKGVDILISAFAKVPQNLRCHLILCGIGDDEDKLREQARALGVEANITWAGWQSELEAFYACADAYAMPSRWESFGLVFLEAMNYTLPVVSTRTQAIPEVVDDGVTGLLSTNENDSEFAFNLIRMAQDSNLRRSLGEAGNIRLREHFSFDKFVDAHVQWYETRPGDLSTLKKI